MHAHFRAFRFVVLSSFSLFLFSPLFPAIDFMISIVRGLLEAGEGTFFLCFVHVDRTLAVYCTQRNTEAIEPAG